MAIWRIKTCKSEAGYRSNASIYKLIRKGLWTKPVKIGDRSSGWPDEEVRALCAARIAGKHVGEIRELVQELQAKRSRSFQTSCVSFDSGAKTKERPYEFPKNTTTRGFSEAGSPSSMEQPLPVAPILYRGLTAAEHLCLHQQVPEEMLEQVLEQNARLLAAYNAVADAWPSWVWNADVISQIDKQRMELARLALLEVRNVDL
ncbi:helix-turn-helix transcriptional regulator [Limnohabitans radicicola]|uniref:AlpA family phage regulatory protein n=1 Tax=Limnohabitans radicicola TaxID=2771427 RepID=A0A927IK35_9BURK|nr:AlpA family phage regulatory protein [Limnohabitans radicicola]MBD8051349.1 AlpA family phage regulatory protein [Limnohabitans radicicola]